MWGGRKRPRMTDKIVTERSPSRIFRLPLRSLRIGCPMDTPDTPLLRSAPAPVKVLHASSANVYGGIETMLVSLARHRALCPELEQHFALCFEGRLSEELSTLEAPLYLLGNARLSRPLSVWRARRTLRRVLDRSRCDVVICHGPRTMIFFATAVRASRRPVVMWAHGVKAGRHWLKWLVRRVPPDLAIGNSRYTQQALGSLFPSVASVVIYSPLEMGDTPRSDAQRASVREEFGTPPMPS